MLAARKQSLVGIKPDQNNMFIKQLTDIEKKGIP
jgi:hypothetical protein